MVVSYFEIKYILYNKLFHHMYRITYFIIKLLWRFKEIVSRIDKLNTQLLFLNR